MQLTIHPGNPLRGTVRLPGDKSLSHRAALFAALAEGHSQIDHFLVSGVTRAMLNALTALGVSWSLAEDRLEVQGRGLAGLRAPSEPISCGNSATTIRMLAGALAAAGVPAVLDGSEGLRRRPMGRIVEPLQAMGVPVAAAAGGCAPLVFAARAAEQRFAPLDITLPVASAQVKSCLLLAGLAAGGPTVLREPGPSRDHTERMLRSMGVIIEQRTLGEDCYETRLLPPVAPLQPLRAALPGDISAAAFLIVAAAITPGSEIRIENVGVNPTRTGLLDALQAMGADIQVAQGPDQAGEPTGALVVRSSRLRGTQIGGPLVVRMIDEFPAFGAAAAFAEGNCLVQDAAELRLKESDRIGTLCGELGKLGVAARELPDGFQIQGGHVHGGTVRPHGDHRLAMSLAVAGLAASTPVMVEDAEIIEESFPSFVATLRSLGAEIEAA